MNCSSTKISNHPSASQYFKSLEKAKTSKEIYTIVNDAFNEQWNQSQTKCFDELFSHRKILQQKLEGDEKGPKVMHRINVLIEYRNILSKKQKKLDPLNSNILSNKIQGKTLSYWIKDENKPDLSDDELKALIQANSIKWNTDPGSMTKLNFLLQLNGKEILNSFLYYFSTLTSFKEQEKNLHGGHLTSLLHHAIEANKPNTVQYLIKIGANVNGVILSDYCSPLIKAIQLLESVASDDTETEKRFSIVTELLNNRQSLQELAVNKVLYFCCHHYRPDDLEFNLALFDHALSILLGCQIRTEEWCEKDRKDIIKFITHINEISGVHEGIDLEGMGRNKFIKIQLHLFLQILTQLLVGPSSSRFSQEAFTTIFEEFLLELETAFISNLLVTWKSLPSKQKKKFSNQFADLLSNYVKKQLDSLQENKEYLLHLG